MPLPLCCVQVMTIKEVFRLKQMDHEDVKLPGFRWQQWYFFFVATFYLYIRWAVVSTFIPTSGGLWRTCAYMALVPRQVRVRLR